MPVEPGNMLLLAHIGSVPALVLPGCARSRRSNGLDWVLQRLHAGLPVGRAEIMRMGIGGLIPLMLVQTRGVGPAVAGASLGVTGTLWAAGSWLNSTPRMQAVGPGHRLTMASVAMSLGAVGPVLIATGHLPLIAGLSTWALSALGMGIASPTPRSDG